jgi:hypothetical protein
LYLSTRGFQSYMIIVLMRKDGRLFLVGHCCGTKNRTVLG